MIKLMHGYLMAIFLGLLVVACTQAKQEEAAKKPDVHLQDATNTASTAKEAELPSLMATTTSGSTLDMSKLQGKFVLILFQPDCDDCQREITQIKENIAAFNGYMMYFISSAPMDKITSFAVEYGLNNNNMVFGQTTVKEVIKAIGPIPAPSVYIYAADKKLVKSFNGEVAIEQILSAL